MQVFSVPLVRVRAESMRRGRYGVFFGGKNSSNKFEIKNVGKKRHQWRCLGKKHLSVLCVPLCEIKKIPHRQAFIDHHHIKSISVCGASVAWMVG